MDAVSVGYAVGQAKPEDPDLCSGRSIAFHREITPPLPPDRLYPSHWDSSRLGIGRPIAVQLPSVYGETRQNHVKFTLVTRLVRS